MVRVSMATLFALVVSACSSASQGAPEEELADGSEGRADTQPLPSTAGSSAGTGGPEPGSTTHAPVESTSTGDEDDHDPPRKTSGAGETGNDETAGPDYTQACVDGCSVEAACGNEWPSEIACILWCEDNLVEAGRFSPFCQMAWENLHACIGTLDCTGYEDYLMGGESCLIASYTHAVECEGQF